MSGPSAMPAALPAPPAGAAPAVPEEGRSYWDVVGRQFRKNKVARVCLWIVTALVLSAILTPFIANDKPLYIRGVFRGLYTKAYSEWRLGAHGELARLPKGFQTETKKWADRQASLKEFKTQIEVSDWHTIGFGIDAIRRGILSRDPNEYKWKNDQVTMKDLLAAVGATDDVALADRDKALREDKEASRSARRDRLKAAGEPGSPATKPILEEWAKDDATEVERLVARIQGKIPDLFARRREAHLDAIALKLNFLAEQVPTEARAEAEHALAEYETLTSGTEFLGSDEAASKSIQDKLLAVRDRTAAALDPEKVYLQPVQRWPLLRSLHGWDLFFLTLTFMLFIGLPILSRILALETRYPRAVRTRIRAAILFVPPLLAGFAVALRPGYTDIVNYKAGLTPSLKDGHTDIEAMDLVLPPIFYGMNEDHLADKFRAPIWREKRETGKELASWKGHEGAAAGVAFSPDGKRAISAGARDIVVWEVDNGRALAHLKPSPESATCVAFSPDGKRALTGADDTAVHLWSVEESKELATWMGHTGTVTAVAFCRDGKKAVSAGADKTVRVWEVETGKELARWTAEGKEPGVKSISVSPDGKFVLWEDGHTLRRGEIETGQETAKWDLSPETVLSVAVNSDGTRGLVVTGAGLEVWDIDAGKRLAKWMAPAEPVVKAAIWSPDGRRAMTAGDTLLQIWDAEAGRPMATWKGTTGHLRSIAWHSDGKRALVGAEDGLTIWSIDIALAVARTDNVYWLGTDENGRDLLTRLLWGGRISLTVGFVAVGIYTGIGIFLGSLAGYYRGIVDLIISRVIEWLLCVPTFFLILAVVALLPPSIYNVMIVIGLTGWTVEARLVRGEFLRLANQDYVIAARALGVPVWRIIFRHVLPNALAPVLVAASFGVAGAILTESSLSFLGLGVPIPDASWGSVLSTARANPEYWWMITFPGFLIFLTVAAYNLVGEGARDAIDPRLKI